MTDLLFQSRLREQANATGHDFTVGDSAGATADALEARPVLVIVDLHVDGVDWQSVVTRAKEQRVPVLAFGRHTEAELLREAREAGCDRVVARSTLVQELPALIQELAAPRE